MDAFDLSGNADEDINNNDTNRDATVFNNLEIDNDFNLEGDDNNDFSSDENDNNDLNIINNIEKFKKFECILSNKEKQTAYDYLQYWAIHKYFVHLDKHKLGKIQASERTAEEVYNKGSYQARNIRKYAKFWLKNGILYKSMQGCHQKMMSFIDDENVINNSLAFIW